MRFASALVWVRQQLVDSAQPVAAAVHETRLVLCATMQYMTGASLLCCSSSNPTHTRPTAVVLLLRLLAGTKKNKSHEKG